MIDEIKRVAKLHGVTLQFLGTHKIIVRGLSRKTVAITIQGDTMYYGAYGVPAFRHPVTGDEIPVTVHADGFFGLQITDPSLAIQAVGIGVRTDGTTYMPPRMLDAFRHALWESSRCCYYCGRKLKLKESTIDHIVPTSRGGSNHTSNLALACLPCNRDKRDMSEAAFRKMKGYHVVYR